MFCQIKLETDNIFVEKSFAEKYKLFFKEIKGKFGYSDYYNRLVNDATWYSDELEKKRGFFL